MKYFKILLQYYKTSVWFAIMLFLLFSPASTYPKVKFFNIPHSDKIVHICMFAMLIFLFQVESRLQNLKFLLFYGILAIAFGAISELIQYAFITGRSGNIYDLLADAAGILCGILFYQYLWQRFFRTKPLKD